MEGTDIVVFVLGILTLPWNLPLRVKVDMSIVLANSTPYSDRPGVWLEDVMKIPLLLQVSLVQILKAEQAVSDLLAIDYSIDVSVPEVCVIDHLSYIFFEGFLYVLMYRFSVLGAIIFVINLLEVIVI